MHARTSYSHLTLQNRARSKPAARISLVRTTHPELDTYNLSWALHVHMDQPLTPYSPDPSMIEASCANQLGTYDSPPGLICTTYPEPYRRTRTSYSHLTLHIRTRSKPVACINLVCMTPDLDRYDSSRAQRLC